MSFEGYWEKLCKKGHYTSFDVYDDEPTVCTFCKEPFEYSHLVDQTNGYNEKDDSTYKAELINKVSEDEWRVDPINMNLYSAGVGWKKIGDG